MLLQVTISRLIKQTSEYRLNSLLQVIFEPFTGGALSKNTLFSSVTFYFLSGVALMACLVLQGGLDPFTKSDLSKDIIQWCFIYYFISIYFNIFFKFYFISLSIITFFLKKKFFGFYSRRRTLCFWDSRLLIVGVLALFLPAWWWGKKQLCLAKWCAGQYFLCIICYLIDWWRKRKIDE